MNEKKDIFEHALKNTRILKMPKQNLSTFGTTNIDYYILSRLDSATRIREGRVMSRRPQIIKPPEMSGELFEGFGEYSEYAEELFKVFGNNPRILNYTFKNTPKSMTDSNGTFGEVFRTIEQDLVKKGRELSAIIDSTEKGWQISIMKFIVEMTLKSAGENITELEQKGMFPDESGIPGYARNRIEHLFRQSRKDRSRINELGRELNRYGLFKEYEDRFFRLMEKE
jgi:hypothetical protein